MDVPAPPMGPLVGGTPPDTGWGVGWTGTSCVDVTVAGFSLKSGATMFSFDASSAMLSCDGGSVVKRAGSGLGYVQMSRARTREHAVAYLESRWRGVVGGDGGVGHGVQEVTGTGYCRIW